MRVEGDSRMNYGRGHSFNSDGEGEDASGLHPLMDVLLQNAAGPVGVFDDGLRLLHGNQTMQNWAERMGCDGEVTLDGLYHPAVAGERMPLVQDSLKVHKPLRLHGMLDGTMTFCSYHPVLLNGMGVVLICQSWPTVATLRPGDGAVNGSFRRTGIDHMGSLSSLSLRELEVFQLIGRGFTTNAVAEALHRSSKTVQNHRIAIGHKLDLGSRVDLSTAAVRSGITDLSSAELHLLWKQSRAAV